MTTGRPERRFSEAFCCFMDILGFKRTLGKNLEAADQQLGKYIAYAWHVAQTWPEVLVLNLSDSLFIVAPSERTGDFLESVLYVQQQSFASGVMVRGGISLGEVVVDDFTISLPNYWGRRLIGRGIVDAVELERTLKGVRLALSPSAAGLLGRAFPDRVVLLNEGGPGGELMWADAKFHSEYVDYLSQLTIDAFQENPTEVRHYVDTLKLLVRNTHDPQVLAGALEAFIAYPLVPPEVVEVWTAAVGRAHQLASTNVKAVAVLNQTKLYRRLLASPIGRDWLANLLTAPPEVRKSVTAALEG